jgi:chromosomal replication initiation ATPase DnaA
MARDRDMSVPARLRLGRVIYNRPLIIDAEIAILGGLSYQDRIDRFVTIVRDVTEWSGHSWEDMISRRRNVQLMLSRQIAQWAVKRACPWLSFPQIGWKFGGRNHATILHAVRKIDRLIADGALELPAHILAHGRGCR